MEERILFMQLLVAALALQKGISYLKLDGAKQTDSANFTSVCHCCLHAAHYASVMTEDVCKSHARLQRKVTLIKLHLMIELIKSATLFLSLRVRLYACEGDWS